MDTDSFTIRYISTESHKTMNFSGIFKSLTGYASASLHRNAIFLITTQVAATLFGFFFWTIAARFYDISAVGEATALISAVNLISSFSLLGLTTGLIRFFNDEKDKSGMINTVMGIVSIFSLLLALIFWLGIDLWTPALIFIKTNILLSFVFILFIVVSSLLTCQLAIFIAARKAQYSFFQSLLAGLRIAILPLMVGFGIAGIFSSFALGYIIAFVLSFIFMFITYSSYNLLAGIKWHIFRKIIRFSFGNYIGDCFRILPGFIMPLIIVNIATSDLSAYFYIAWMIASLFFIIPYATNSSLLAESSYNFPELRSHVLKASKFIFLILLPLIILIIFIGHYLLHLFGESYVTGSSSLMLLLAFSSIPVAINEIYVSLNRVNKNIIPIIAVYGFVAVVTVSGSFFLIPLIGIIGIGIAWIGSNSIAAIVSIVNLYRFLVIKPSKKDIYK